MPQYLSSTQQVTSRLRKDENGNEMYQHEKCTCKDLATFLLKPGFHIVVSVVSVVAVVRKKFIGPIEFILSRTTSCICHFFCIEHLYGRFP